MRSYLFNVGVAGSTLINALTGGRWPETMSYRSAIARRDGKRWGCVLCRFLDALDRHHCAKTMAWWKEREN